MALVWCDKFQLLIIVYFRSRVFSVDFVVFEYAATNLFTCF